MVHKTRTAGRGLLVTAVLATLCAVPAQAGGREFDDGFEHELGRLVATEAFFLGKWMLASVYESAVHRPGHGPAGPHREGRCEVETIERVYRDAEGEVVEYERREVCRAHNDAEPDAERDWYDD